MEFKNPGIKHPNSSTLKDLLEATLDLNNLPFYSFIRFSILHRV
jgi:hypothetical protein